MPQYGFRVSFIVDANDPELAQKELEKLFDSSYIEWAVEEGPDDLDEDEEEEN